MRWSHHRRANKVSARNFLKCVRKGQSNERRRVNALMSSRSPRASAQRGPVFPACLYRKMKTGGFAAPRADKTIVPVSDLFFA
jgi:hypothetical protein